MNHVRKQIYILEKASEHIAGVNEKILWSLHAVKKLRLEKLWKAPVEQALKKAIIIEHYPEHGRPLPDYLLLGFIDADTIHVVAAVDETFDRIVIITVYRPDIKRWENDWKTRKNKVKKCPLCGGGMDEGATTMPFFIAEKVVVIKNVPAEICADCGEAYMQSCVVGEIESILDRLEELHSEVSIIYYVDHLL